MIRVLINGCNGKMGQALAQVCAHSDKVRVACGVDAMAGDIKHPFAVYGHIGAVTEDVDVVVDFSRPAALRDLLAFALSHRCALVLCTTGYSADELTLIGQAARRIALFRSANMSLGVNLAMDLCKKAAAFLGDGSDIEIIEKHHSAKVDAPSGTAIMLMDAINAVYMNSRTCVCGRSGADARRTRGEIGIHSVRGGNITGDHEVLFIGPEETLSIAHTAHSRQVFAAGALRAAEFIYNKPPGQYNMQDMLTQVSAVTSITADDNQALLSIAGIPAQQPLLGDLFARLRAAQINVDMISQTLPAQGTLGIVITLPRDTAPQAQQLAHALFADVPGCTITIRSDIVKLSIEGPGMEHQSGVAARFFESLGNAQAQPLAITTSETKVSCCVAQENRRAAVEALMREFNL